MKLAIIGSGQHIGKYDGENTHIMVLNKVISRFPNAEHHVSLHPCFTVTHKAMKHSHKPHRFVDCVWKYQNNGGGSALLALHIALNMGYRKIAFVGVPLSGKYGDSISKNCWKKYRYDNIEKCKRVRSFSGYTEQLFGPANGWFDQ